MVKTIRYLFCLISIFLLAVFGHWFIVSRITSKTLYSFTMVLFLYVLVILWWVNKAALVGKKYGHYKLWNNKSIIGFIAFFISSLFSYFILKIYDNSLSPKAILVFSFLSGFLELIGLTHDNIYVPIQSTLLFRFLFK